MAKTKKTYPEETRLKAVKELIISGKSATELADQLGIEANLLRQWKSRYIQEIASVGMEDEKSLSVEEQNIHLKVKVENLQNEINILKKALAILFKDTTC